MTLDDYAELSRLRRFKRSIEACVEFYEDKDGKYAVIDEEQFEFLLAEADGFKERQ